MKMRCCILEERCCAVARPRHDPPGPVPSVVRLPGVHECQAVHEERLTNAALVLLCDHKTFFERQMLLAIAYLSRPVSARTTYHPRHPVRQFRLCILSRLPAPLAKGAARLPVPASSDVSLDASGVYGRLQQRRGLPAAVTDLTEGRRVSHHAGSSGSRPGAIMARHRHPATAAAGAETATACDSVSQRMS